MTGMATDTKTDPEVRGEHTQTAQLNDDQDPNKGTVGQTKEPSWFDKATKMYVGKRTNLTPDDELGQELWNSVENANKLTNDIDKYKKEAEELSPFKTDLEWIMSQPKLAQQVRATLTGQATAGVGEGQDDDLSDDEKRNRSFEQRFERVEQLISHNLDQSIAGKFESHLKELQGKYPSMDVKTVRRIARAERMIYDPKAPEKVEELAKANHDWVEKLKQETTDKTYGNLRNKGKRTIPTGGGGGATRTNAQSFKENFDQVWEEEGLGS